MILKSKIEEETGSKVSYVWIAAAIVVLALLVVGMRFLARMPLASGSAPAPATAQTVAVSPSPQTVSASGEPAPEVNEGVSELKIADEQVARLKERIEQNAALPTEEQSKLLPKESTLWNIQTGKVQVQ